MNQNTKLRVLSAVVAHRSITVAAQQLGVTQPAVSQSIRSLENEYGVELFIRHGRRINPTELALSLAEIGTKIASLEEQAEELLKAGRRLERVTLRLGADTPGRALQLLGPLYKKIPHLRATLMTGNSQRLREAVLDGRLDAAIFADNEPDARLRSVPLVATTLVGYVSNKHPLAKRSAVTLSELASYDFVSREKGSRTRLALERELERAGITLRVVLECDRRESVHEAVANGVGVGVVSRDELPHDDRITALQLTDVEILTQEHLVCLEDRARLRLLRMITSVAKHMTQP